MTNKSYIVLVFRSRQHALNYADIMEENGIHATLIPTPKELSLGCGFSIKFENGYLAEVNELEKSYPSQSRGMYSITYKNNVAKFVKLK